jgi:hypothetical protein
MPDGGRIRVWADATADRRRLRIGVSDDGHGMTAEVQRQAFDPFFTTKKRRLSTGLGLSLVHSVVTSSRGSIDVESAPGAGTTIVLSFPAIDPPAGACPAAVPSTHGKATVSLADERTSAWVAGLLRSAGYDVFRNGEPPSDDAVLWVTDGSPRNLARARGALAGRPDLDILVLGAVDEAWSRLGVVAVEQVGDLAAIESAIHDLAAERAGVKHR